MFSFWKTVFLISSIHQGIVKHKLVLTNYYKNKCLFVCFFCWICFFYTLINHWLLTVFNKSYINKFIETLGMLLVIFFNSRVLGSQFSYTNYCVLASGIFWCMLRVFIGSYLLSVTFLSIDNKTSIRYVLCSTVNSLYVKSQGERSIFQLKPNRNNE